MSKAKEKAFWEMIKTELFSDNWADHRLGEMTDILAHLLNVNLRELQKYPGFSRLSTQK
jgi:hypothetical protein